MIIGISGKRGAGKDTLADFLVQNHGFEKLSLARRLKDRAAEDFDLSSEQLHGALKETPIRFLGGKTPREIMISYGQYFRSIDPCFWVRQIDLPEVEKLVGLVCVSDVRFVNEADYIRGLGGIIVRLERNPALNIYGPTLINDISETDLDDYSFDRVLPADKNIEPHDLEEFAEKLFYEGPSLARARNIDGFR